MKIILFRSTITLVLVASLFAGCASTQPVPESTSSILLTHAQTRHSRAAMITFPAGVYTPSFQTQYGIYFRAPGHLIGRSLGINQTLAGGVFVPFKTASDQHQAAWYDQPRSGDVVDAMIMQSTYRYPFEPPLEFEYVQTGTAYRDIPRTAPPPGM